jgi:protein gp37
MGTKSDIEWLLGGNTWNPLAGCTRKSRGCDHCYAAAMALRLEAMALQDIREGRDPKGKRKYIGVATQTPNGNAAFNGVINLDMDGLAMPLRWKTPVNIFVNSMSDLFHDNVPDAFIHEVFQIVRQCPQHCFNILTKRPARMAAYSREFGPFPSNVLAVASIEDQATSEERIPDLLQVNAKWRGLSVEPLLGPIDLIGWLTGYWRNWIHVIYCGGESGPRARPMHPEWAISLCEQAVVANVNFFFKQWGEWMPSAMPRQDLHGQVPAVLLSYNGRQYCDPTWAEAVALRDSHQWLMYKVGKHKAGRSLNQRTWDDLPPVVIRR